VIQKQLDTLLSLHFVSQHSITTALSREQTLRSRSIFNRKLIYFKAFAILGFRALTGVAQECEKGNNHNNGDTCHGATGNLACSHNLKQVVNTLTTLFNKKTTFAVMIV
jgi:hypothetical protein